MKTECIWKCQTGKIIVKVVKVSDDWRFEGNVYRVYVMRQWWHHMTYDRLENALAAATCVSLLGNYNVMISKKS